MADKTALIRDGLRTTRLTVAIPIFFAFVGNLHCAVLLSGTRKTEQKNEYQMGMSKTKSIARS